MSKTTNTECYRLMEGYLEEIRPERVEEFKKDPETLGLSMGRTCNYTDKDIYEFVNAKSRRELEEWEIEDIITYMAKDIAGIFNICGCGYPDETLDFMRRVLNCFNSERVHDLSQPYKNGYFEHELFKKEFGIDFYGKPDEQPHYHVYLWVLYNLDELGVTEHGINVFCSYLAPWKGHYIRDILNAWYEYYKEDAKDGDQAS